MKIENFFKYYEEKNNKIVKNSSISELEIFNNTNNITNGISNDITTLEQIPFYTCTQHVNLDYYIKDKLNLLSSKEFEDFKNIVLEVKKLTTKFGNVQLPKSSLAAAFYQLRIIKKFFPNSRKIFELGPGSGYLSLLLAFENKIIFSADVTQAYYIYQHELFNHFNIVNELAYENKNFIYENGKINHVPWWIYSQLKQDQIDIDLVVFNNGICELNNRSFDYFIYFLGLINNPDVLLIGSGQEKYYYSHYEAIKKFSYNGYHLSKNSCNNEDEIYILKYDSNYKRKNFFKSNSLQRKFDLIRQIFFFYNKNKIYFEKGDVNLKKVKDFYDKFKIINKDELLITKLSNISQI